MQTERGSRTRRPRRHAVPGKPVVDPAAWTREAMAASAAWAYPLSEAEIAEIDAAVAGVAARGLDLMDIGRDDFPLPTLGPALAGIRDELFEGRGFVLVRGVPVARYSRVEAAAAFWGLGRHLGDPVSQNAQGHLLGHVKDLDKDYDDPRVRGYQTRARMGFHADQCDIVALMCVQPARSGGASRIVSSVTLHNEMLKRRPDLVTELGWKFYWTRHGEVPPGEQPWYRQAVFTYHLGSLTTRGVSAHIRKSQSFPEVPRFTPAQLEAMEMFRDLADSLAMDMEFRQGDVQFLMNHVVLHSRTEFEDWPEPERKRHLFRLWLTTRGARPLPPEFAEQTRGIRVAGATPTAPLDAAAVD